MREFTQTVTATEANGWTGNCWQTAVACLLEVEPSTLPPQGEYDWRRQGPDGKTEYGPSYSVPLGAYLRKHHELAYVECHGPEELLGLLRIAEPGWHLMTGRTVRSDAFFGMRHVVVGRHGKVAWDPHPSRAGLLEEVRWAFLVPFPKSWEPHYTDPCVCQACDP